MLIPGRGEKEIMEGPPGHSAAAHARLSSLFAADRAKIAVRPSCLSCDVWANALRAPLLSQEGNSSFTYSAPSVQQPPTPEPAPSSLPPAVLPTALQMQARPCRTKMINRYDALYHMTAPAP